VTASPINAALAGTWRLGDLTVNRIGFGAMRLPQYGPAFAPDAVPRDRDGAIAARADWPSHHGQSHGGFVSGPAKRKGPGLV